MNCPVCSRPLPSRCTPWTCYCADCDHWTSSLMPVTTDVEKDDFLARHDNGENPIDYLDNLRLKNFRAILRTISGIDPRPGSILEIGCGAGLFLKCAEREGYRAEGIEAYAAMARLGISQGRKIRIGLFPDCLLPSDKFDAIVFNDVFEHLPDPLEMLRICHRHLNDRGCVVLNLPNSHGLFFRVATLAVRLGISGPWDRLWQKMFFTPHLNYFSQRSLALACKTTGFAPAIPFQGLDSIAMTGLWSRISADQSAGLPQRCLIWTGSLALSVIAPFFPSDCAFQVFAKKAP